MQDLDISIVIANAGLLNSGKFAKQDAGKLCQILDVNVYHYTLMAKIFIPWLIEKRKNHRSAFVAVSSSSYLRHMPSFLTYTASKAFATHLTLAIKEELMDTPLIDVQTVVPFATATNVVGNDIIGLVGTPVSKAVDEFLRQLHSGYMLVFGTLPNEVVARFCFQLAGTWLRPLFDFGCWQMQTIIENL